MKTIENNRKQSAGLVSMLFMCLLIAFNWMFSQKTDFNELFWLQKSSFDFHLSVTLTQSKQIVEKVSKEV